MKIRFTIPGKPVAQGRPRFYRRGKYVSAVDPQASRVYKADISYIAKKELEKINFKNLMEGAIGLNVTAYFPCPKSQYRKTNPRLERHHAKRPDADNIAKSVKDGLNGVLYHDDGQIAELTIKKRIAAQGEPPRLEVEIYTLPDIS